MPQPHSLQRAYSESLRPTVNGQKVPTLPSSLPFPYLRRLKDVDLIKKARHGSSGEQAAAKQLCLERGITLH